MLSLFTEPESYQDVPCNVILTPHCGNSFEQEAAIGIKKRMPVVRICLIQIDLNLSIYRKKQMQNTSSLPLPCINSQAEASGRVHVCKTRFLGNAYKSGRKSLLTTYQIVTPPSSSSLSSSSLSSTSCISVSESDISSPSSVKTLSG